MSNMTILSKFPIILTKDQLWKPRTPAKEGAIILLPQDAVLVIPEADDPVSDLVVKSRIPELPEDSIHEPTSPNPSPSKGLTKATSDVANPPSDPKRKANT